MDKLGAYYALCPLIDANSILGISEEVGKGLVIVTLGKNISSRYKVRINWGNVIYVGFGKNLATFKRDCYRSCL